MENHSVYTQFSRVILVIYLLCEVAMIIYLSLFVRNMRVNLRTHHLKANWFTKVMSGILLSYFLLVILHNSISISGLNPNNINKYPQ